MPISEAEAETASRLELEDALAAERARADALEARYQQTVVVLDAFVSYAMNVRTPPAANQR